MAVCKKVSFKKTEQQLVDLVEDEDFSSYVKKLIKIDHGLLPISCLRCGNLYTQLEMPKPQIQQKHSHQEKPIKGQVEFDVETERDDLDL